ncbi:unnamed protein product [Bursaphelenchus xylophilus]|uniref:(pine wood nematode) hypothetical protein n=1 Tax=Bursaphelenchus xylophilus TaxID=6326 RepID=A0A1I7SFL1_BURXY|nr:unnamed protein product [Bursaphelenchus xylophilus]CAG9105069.1 unnamed protein product [Bursaphelenchus xylophilus]
MKFALVLLLSLITFAVPTAADPFQPNSKPGKELLDLTEERINQKSNSSYYQKITKFIDGTIGAGDLLWFAKFRIEMADTNCLKSRKDCKTAAKVTTKKRHYYKVEIDVVPPRIQRSQVYFEPIPKPDVSGKSTTISIS